MVVATNVTINGTGGTVGARTLMLLMAALDDLFAGAAMTLGSKPR
jgi:hypothetical protein